jgi:hypothetical protein
MPSSKPAAVRTLRHANVLSGIQVAKDANNPYRQGLWTVVFYSAQVRAYQFPKISNPNQWPGGATAYQQALDTWANTTGTLQGWTLSTLQNVIAIPQQLINASTQNIIPGLNTSIQLSQLLIQNPNNPSLKAGLMTTLQILNIFFGQYSSQIKALVQSLQNQATVFDADAKVMNTLASQALQTAGNEKQLIVNLNQQIANLNSDITASAVAIAGGSLASILGIGMGILGIVLAPVTGGISLALLVPAVLITAGGAYIIALNSMKIEQDKAAIAGLNNQISLASADITLLNVMATTLTGFSSQVDALKSALNAILVPWEASQTYLTNTIAEINSIENATSDNWTQVCNELTDILNGWNGLIVVMNQLEADAQVAPTSNLQLGMSDTQVQQVMNASPKVSLVQYLSRAA